MSCLRARREPVIGVLQLGLPLFTRIIYIIQLDAQKMVPKYGSADRSAAINGAAQWGGLLNYLPLRITRPLLGSSGGDYSLNLSSVLHVSLFTSFLLKQI